MENELTKNQVEPGNYFYKMPNWENYKQVNIFEENGELFVRFQEGYYPYSLSEISDRAIFIKSK
jgi:hypothetical protein